MARMTCTCGAKLDNHEAPNDVPIRNGKIFLMVKYTTLDDSFT